MSEATIINYDVNGKRKRRMTIPGRRFVWVENERVDIQSVRDMARRDFKRNGDHNMQFVNMLKSVFNVLWIHLPYDHHFAHTLTLVSDFLVYQGVHEGSLDGMIKPRAQLWMAMDLLDPQSLQTDAILIFPRLMEAIYQRTYFWVHDGEDSFDQSDWEWATDSDDCEVPVLDERNLPALVIRQLDTLLFTLLPQMSPHTLDIVVKLAGGNFRTFRGDVAHIMLDDRADPIIHMMPVAHPSKSLMLAVHKTHLHTWDLDTGLPIMSTYVHGNDIEIKSAIALPNGNLATCGGQQEASMRDITIWDPLLGHKMQILRHTDIVEELIALRDGTILSYAKGDDAFIQWNLVSGAGSDLIPSNTANIVDDLWKVYEVHNVILAIGNDHCINVWSMQHPGGPYVYNGRVRPYAPLKWTGFIALNRSDAAIVAFHDNDDGVYIWDLDKEGQPLEYRERFVRLSGHTKTVEAMVELWNGNLATGARDNTIIVWDVNAHSIVHKLVGHVGSNQFGQGIPALIELKDTRLLSSGRDRTLRIWDLITGNCQLIMRDHRAIVSRMGWFNGILVTGDVNGTTIIWR
jgi:hypothetical protein